MKIGLIDVDSHNFPTGDDGDKMTAKQELNEIKSIYYQVVNLNQRRWLLYEEAYSLQSPAGKLSPDKVQTSLDGDRFADTYIRIEETEKQLEESLRELDAKRNRIIAKIESIQNLQQKRVLYNHYVLFMTFEDIAEMLDVSLRHIYRLHGEGLKKYSKICSMSL